MAYSLATFPSFALYGPALGMTTVVPRPDPTRPAKVVPSRIVHAVHRTRATVMSGSPALLAEPELPWGRSSPVVAASSAARWSTPCSCAATNVVSLARGDYPALRS